MTCLSWCTQAANICSEEHQVVSYWMSSMLEELTGCIGKFRFDCTVSHDDVLQYRLSTYLVIHGQKTTIGSLQLKLSFLI